MSGQIADRLIAEAETQSQAREETGKEPSPKKPKYTDEQYPSPSKCGSNAVAAALQGQEWRSKGVPSFSKDKMPFVVNGRCVLEHSPAALVHPAFGRAIDGLKKQPHELTIEDWALYKQLEKVLPFYYNSEANLQVLTSKVLNEYLFSQLMPIAQLLDDTDGVILGGLGAYLCIIEYKQKQDAAEMQIARYYFDYVSKCAQLRSPWTFLTSLLCASIEIVGHEIRLGAYWMEERVAVARLGAAEIRLDQTLEQRCCAAALVCSWVHLVEDLRNFYLELELELLRKKWRPPQESPEFSTPVPYPLTTGSFSLTDPEVVVPSRLYRVRHQTKGKMMVKFVDRFYCQEAHEAWMAANVAVEATFEPLPGGNIMIVMPELSRSDGWYTFSELGSQEQIASKRALMELVEKAHGVTVKGRQFVHGDCRRSNVLAKKCLVSNRVTELRLIDLDWAGVAGQSRYLVEPNEWLGPGRRRPQGVQLGAVLLAEHDFKTLRACFGSLWNESNVPDDS